MFHSDIKKLVELSTVNLALVHVNLNLIKDGGNSHGNIDRIQSSVRSMRFDNALVNTLTMILQEYGGILHHR